MAQGSLKTNKSIPIYSQTTEAVGGLYVVMLPYEGNNDYVEKLDIHRDDFYIFFVLTKGKVIMKCDLLEVELMETSLGLMNPFQVHSVVEVSADAAGYFISVAPFLIPNHCAEGFQNLKIADQFQEINTAEKRDFLDTVSLLHRSFQNLSFHKTEIVNGLFNALIYRIANIFHLSGNCTIDTKNKSATISADFKKLVSKKSFLESPSFYANELHVSTSHLNDCVRAATGKSVTYWLQNAMVVEAQRLLYYTENNVNEIAYQLGFEDHTYFSRLFKKITKETPLAFRKKFRE